MIISCELHAAGCATLVGGFTSEVGNMNEIVQTSCPRGLRPARRSYLQKRREFLRTIKMLMPPTFSPTN